MLTTLSATAALVGLAFLIEKFSNLCTNNTKTVLLAALSGIVLSAFLLAKVVVYHQKNGPNHHKKIRAACSATTLADYCRMVIQGKEDPDTGKLNTISSHAARAGPNERLKPSFGIHSCFTSSNPSVCKQFRKGVDDLFNAGEIVWLEYARAAKTVLQVQLDLAGNKVNLFDLVQMLTLKTMLRVLWGRDAEDTTFDDAISALARGVNEQWIRSKEDFNASSLLGHRVELFRLAKEVFPEWDGDVDNQNPFNLILPGYETMWRVVLRGFLELTARGHADSALWKAAVNAFALNPTRAQLTTFVQSCPVSAERVVLELLRMYPPTRRIYRRFTDEAESTHDRSANIEALHRTTHWGPKPLMFEPLRWVEHPEGVDDANFMPFGHAPFRCPAKQHRNREMPFGISMISLLLGELVAATAGWQINSNSLPAREDPLDSNREAYDELVLQKVDEE